MKSIPLDINCDGIDSHHAHTWEGACKGGMVMGADTTLETCSSRGGEDTICIHEKKLKKKTEIKNYQEKVWYCKMRKSIGKELEMATRYMQPPFPLAHDKLVPLHVRERNCARDRMIGVSVQNLDQKLEGACCWQV